MREFATGANRDSDEGKLKYEGFLSPAVLRRYAEYMHRHRVQSDGMLREPDNWQKGIDFDTYCDSLIRHTQDAWYLWRESSELDDMFDDLLCAILFNAMGMLYERLNDRTP